MLEIVIKVSQLVALAITSFGVVFGAVRGISELKMRRIASETEQRWKQADLARQLLERIESDEAIQLAFRMLDYDKGDIDVRGQYTVNYQDVRSALRVKELLPESKETEIRDCFHALFGSLDHLEHYIRINLIVFQDVEYPLEYWMSNMLDRWEIFSEHLSAYRFKLAKKFVERFRK